MAADSGRTLFIGTYNVWLLPPVVTFFANSFGINVSPKKLTRARHIADAIPEGLDILVLCECFCERSTDELCQLLSAKQGLKYRTHILGSRTNICARGKLLSGGVVICSRHPLECIEELPYGSICARDDSLADKGAMYVRLTRSDGLHVNIFATHTQAWDTPACRTARMAQIGKLRKFVDEKDIPKEEVVLVVGDLNVPRQVSDEYEFMLQQLRCKNSNANDLTNPSFNHITNALAAKGPSSGGSSTTLDYILVSCEHLQPLSSSADVTALKSKTPYEFKGKLLNDLSDHYPVFGKLTFA